MAVEEESHPSGEGKSEMNLQQFPETGD